MGVVNGAYRAERERKQTRIGMKTRDTIEVETKNELEKLPRRRSDWIQNYQGWLLRDRKGPERALFWSE